MGSSNEEDRISDLPAPLISHILSFLPTQYAVQTSALSTFWRHQWTSITQLRFDDASSPQKFSTSTRAEAIFVKFVYHVLRHLTTACPDVFQLKCSQYYEIRHIHSWVSAALSRGIQHIDISVPGFIVDGKLLHSCLFSGTNVVVLKVGRGFVLEIPTYFSLDSLKILHLTVAFPDNDSLPRLVSRCPSLEELKICGKTIYMSTPTMMTVLKISSIALKRLILVDLPFFVMEVVLNTPGLQYIEQHGRRVLENGYSIELLPCLDRAHIAMGLHPGQLCLFYNRKKGAASIARSMESLLVGISGIKYLYLSKEACEILEHINPSEVLPNFPRLIEVEMCETSMRLLAAFLHNSPELATLSFRHSFRYTNGRTLHPTNEVPYCVLYKLEQIEVKDFHGQQMELDIVRYFLEKSKCLNKLLIRYCSKTAKEKKEETSQKLLKLHRASTSCTIVIT